MIPCSLRTLGECPVPCKDHCSVQPPKAQEAPIRFRVRDQLVVIVFGIAMTGFAYLALSEADRQFKAQDLRNQEVSRAYR